MEKNNTGLHLKFLPLVPFHWRNPRRNTKTSQDYVTQQELFQSCNALALGRGSNITIRLRGYDLTEYYLMGPLSWANTDRIISIYIFFLCKFSSYKKKQIKKCDQNQWLGLWDLKWINTILGKFAWADNVKTMCPRATWWYSRFYHLDWV